MNGMNVKDINRMFHADDETVAWAAKSYRAAVSGNPVPCRGCGKTFALPRMYRCFYCGSYFCPDCARAHFGDRHEGLFKSIPSNGDVVCMDTGCMSRTECSHAVPHAENEECTWVRGADEPCARCVPVDDGGAS